MLSSQKAACLAKRHQRGNMPTHSCTHGRNQLHAVLSPRAVALMDNSTCCMQHSLVRAFTSKPSPSSNRSLVCPACAILLRISEMGLCLMRSALPSRAAVCKSSGCTTQCGMR
eukprot:5486867-Amphidinium_carterae.1